MTRERRARSALTIWIASASLLTSLAARADSVVSQLPGRVRQEVREQLLGQGERSGPDVSDYGNLTRDFMIYVLGKPFLFSQEDVDRIVGAPWYLNDSTRLKLEALPPRLRLRLYSVLARYIDIIRYAPTARLGLALPGAPRSLGVLMDEETRMRSLDGLINTFDGYFRTEELIDLAFYGLSKQAFFPRTQEGWSGLRDQLPKYDLALGLLGAAALAGVEQANVDISGLLLKGPDDSFRVGWFAAAKHVGFQWRPRLIAGLQGATPGFETSLGWVEYFRAEAPSEVRSIEWTMREHLLTRVSRAFRWETSGTAILRFVWEHTDPEERLTFRGQVNFYARRPAILEDPQIDFLIEGSLGTDFRHCHRSDVSVGLEAPRQSIAGALRFASLTDPAERLPTDWHAGVVLGGALGEVDDSDCYHRVEDLGVRVRAEIHQLKTVEERYCALAAQTRPADTRAAAAEAARKEVARSWLEEAASDLKRDSERYGRARRRCQVQRARLPGPLTEGEAKVAELLPGPLSEEELRFAREHAAFPESFVDASLCPQSRRVEATPE